MATRYICVYCGSRDGNDPRYKELAQQVGRLIAKAGWGLVYGGGKVGLMGIVADSVLEHGGCVIGVIPRFMISKEVAHFGCTELIEVEDMHERKAVMAQKSSAFLALPGGYGTYDELFEMITWAQLNIHQSPIGILNSTGFYTDLLKFLDNVVVEGFISAEHRGLLQEIKKIEDVGQLLK